VARVDILLDPTWFKRPYITLKKPPFEFTTDGWGSIQINVTVVLKDGWKIKQANGTQSSQRTIEYILGWPTEASRRANVSEKREMKQFEIQRDT
jgi:transcription initiation factor IIF auxiliary subunit